MSNNKSTTLLDDVRALLHMELDTFTDDEIIDGRTIAVNLDEATYAFNTWFFWCPIADRIAAAIAYIDRAKLDDLRMQS